MPLFSLLFHGDGIRSPRKVLPSMKSSSFHGGYFMWDSLFSFWTWHQSYSKDLDQCDAEEAGGDPGEDAGEERGLLEAGHESPSLTGRGNFH